MNMNILETRRLEYQYPDGTRALRGVSVSLIKNKKIAFLGANGAGKSTLLLHFIGILRPSRGEVLFKGKALKYDRASLLSLRRCVGMVFQNPDDQLFAPTVAQDVSFGPKNLGMSGDEARARVKRALKIAGIEELADKPPHLLSYGQKKRVAIAGVLAMDPEVLILDEPLAGLDPAGRRRFIEFLDELAKSKTIAVATHDVDFAYEWADYVYVLSHGRVLAEGEPGEVLQMKAEKASLSAPKVLELYEALAELGLAMPETQPGNMFELVQSVASLGVRVATAEERLKEGEAVGVSIERGRILARPFRGGEAPGKVIKALGRKVIVSANGNISAGGRVYLYPIENFDANTFRKLLERRGVEFVASLSSEARMLAEREGIALAPEGAPLERCLLKALAGYSTLLLLPEGSIEETLKKIRSYLSSDAAPEIEVLKQTGGRR